MNVRYSLCSIWMLSKMFFELIEEQFCRSCHSQGIHCICPVFHFTIFKEYFKLFENGKMHFSILLYIQNQGSNLTRLSDSHAVPLSLQPSDSILTPSSPVLPQIPLHNYQPHTLCISRLIQDIWALSFDCSSAFFFLIFLIKNTQENVVLNMSRFKEKINFPLVVSEKTT